MTTDTEEDPPQQQQQEQQEEPKEEVTEEKEEEEDAKVPSVNSEEQQQQQQQQETSSPKEGSAQVRTLFPAKLYEMLADSTCERAISWAGHGRAWKVHDQEKLEEHLSKYFKHSRYLSFARQVQLWGFKRVSKGPDKGSYFHDFFLRGHPDLLEKIHRPKKGRRPNNILPNALGGDMDGLVGMFQNGGAFQGNGVNASYLLQAQQQQQQQQQQQFLSGGAGGLSSFANGGAPGLGMNQMMNSGMFTNPMFNPNASLLAQNLGGNFQGLNGAPDLYNMNMNGENNSLANGTGQGPLSPYALQQQQLQQQLLLNQAQAQAQYLQLQQQQMANLNFMRNSGMPGFGDASNLGSSPMASNFMTNSSNPANGLNDDDQKDGSGATSS